MQAACHKCTPLAVCLPSPFCDPSPDSSSSTYAGTAPHCQGASSTTAKAWMAQISPHFIISHSPFSKLFALPIHWLLLWGQCFTQRARKPHSPWTGAPIATFTARHQQTYYFGPLRTPRDRLGAPVSLHARIQLAASRCATSTGVNGEHPGGKQT